jgi:hypothetical protein
MSINEIINKAFPGLTEDQLISKVKEWIARDRIEEEAKVYQGQRRTAEAILVLNYLWNKGARGRDKLFKLCIPAEMERRANGRRWLPQCTEDCYECGATEKYKARLRNEGIKKAINERIDYLEGLG